MERECGPRPATNERNEDLVNAGRAAHRDGYEAGADSSVASCADWFGWHAAVQAIAETLWDRAQNVYGCREYTDHRGCEEGTCDACILDGIRGILGLPEWQDGGADGVTAVAGEG